jgi:hypothetical protein
MLKADDENYAQITVENGAPPPRLTLLQRWLRLSKMAKAFSIAVVVFVLFLIVAIPMLASGRSRSTGEESPLTCFERGGSNLEKVSRVPVSWWAVRSTPWDGGTTGAVHAQHVTHDGWPQ